MFLQYIVHVHNIIGPKKVLWCYKSEMIDIGSTSKIVLKYFEDAYNYNILWKEQNTISLNLHLFGVFACKFTAAFQSFNPWNFLYMFAFICVCQ